MSSYLSHGNYLINFFNVNEENKVLTKARYELYSIDGKASGVIIEPNDQGRYKLNSGTQGYEEKGDPALLVPDLLKEVFEGVETAEDCDALAASGFNVSTGSYGATNVKYVRMHAPIIVKQVKGEPGYKQNDIIIRTEFELRFNYDRETGEKVSKTVAVGAWLDYGQIIYGGEIGPITSIEQYGQIQYSMLDGLDVGRACLTTNYGLIATADCDVWENSGSSGFNMVPYFVEEKGEVKFEVENLVNGMAKYNASKDKKLEYTIKVKNTGNASSGDNIIKTYVPKEVEVNQNKISDGGVYNKNDHTITWNIDYIEIGEVLSVSYEATAPEKTDGKELIGKSSIQSGQVLTEVYSTNTIVTLDRIVEVINNPNTGTMVYIANTNIGVPISVLVMFVIALLAVIVVLIKRMKYLKKTH